MRTLLVAPAGVALGEQLLHPFNRVRRKDGPQEGVFGMGAVEADWDPVEKT